ncbi:MAG: glycosyltransferase family 2 protein [Halobacteriales archaeon]|nr:glycosyltransferase family 2 protein [Halobacteriales archaeon]
MTDAPVAVLTLQWNVWAQTERCLAALGRLDWHDLLVVAVDNGSTDGAEGALLRWVADGGAERAGFDRVVVRKDGAPAERAPSPAARELLVVLLPENTGYSGGNNAAVRAALQRRPDLAHVLLLNNDARPAPDCLRHLTAASRALDAAIVGAMVRDGSGRSLSFARRPGWAWQWRHAIAPAPSPPGAPAAWPTLVVNAAACLVRRDVLDALVDARGELLHPGLFLYEEELDLCLRAHRLGFRCAMARDAVAVHAGMGGRRSTAAEARFFYYFNRNRVALARELLAGPERVAFHAAHLPLTVGRAAKLALRRHPELAAATLRGARDGYAGKTGRWEGHGR